MHVQSSTDIYTSLDANLRQPADARLIRNNGVHMTGERYCCTDGGEAKTMMEEETVRAEQRREGKLEQARDSSADASQTKRRHEEMKAGACKLMSAQTQTPLPRLDPHHKLKASPFFCFFPHSPL